MMGYAQRQPDGSEVWVEPQPDGTYQVTPLDPNRPGAQPSGGTTAPNIAPAPAPVAAPYDWSGLWGAMGDTNQQQFDWTKNSFGMDLDERKRQADMQNAIQQQQLGLQGSAQKSQLAQALLSGAASLRGPADWLSYAGYTNGGGDIFNRLYGNQAAPAFGAPTGNSSVMTIEKLLQDLGLGGLGGGTGGAGGGTPGGTPGGGAPGTYQTANGPRTLEQMRQELFQASGGMQEKLSADDATTIRDYGAVTGKPVTGGGGGDGGAEGSGWYQQMVDWYNQQKEATGQRPSGEAWNQAFSTATGYDNSIAQGMQDRGYQYVNTFGNRADQATQERWLQELLAGQKQAQQTNQAMDQATAPITGYTNDINRSGTSFPTGQAPGTGQTPLPHQINPAVWDSLSPTAQTMILASAGMGNTPSGAWSPDDYLRQLNAARPQGTAPQSVSYNYGQQSMF